MNNAILVGMIYTVLAVIVHVVMNKKLDMDKIENVGGAILMAVCGAAFVAMVASVPSS
jgi:putative Ca2+/H+ antiporter (TMEM165/GDT1 family)